MARTHVWQFLVNQAGEPIDNAKIYITLAGTDDAVWVYFDEFGSSGSRTGPQVSTIENGYFEFWIDEKEDFDPEGTVDNTNAISYGFSQKFKIRWEKTGVASGYVDYVDVFPPNRYFRKLDLTDCSSEALDKVISNSLGCKWDTHSEWDVRLDGLPVHGLEYVKVNLQDTIQNKIISNYDGWLWTQHEASTVEGYSPSGSYGPPHDLWPVDVLSQDLTYNKVVNNKLLYDITQKLNNINSIIMTIKPVGEIANANWETGDGVNDAFEYEAVLTHGLGISYPDVTCYVTNEHGEEVLVKTLDVIYLDEDSIKIRIDFNPVYMTVRITT